MSKLMTSEGNASTGPNTYELTCTNCAFEITVEGTVYKALEVADDHQDEHGETDSDHFVNFERTTTSE
jgi:hypothetical protein